MAKKLKFSLEMTDGKFVRNLKEFKKHFDAKKAIGYFKDGRLLNWLHSRSYNKEADKIAQLLENDPQLHQKICEIFDVNADVDDIDVEKITRRTERLTLLKQYTDDNKILEQVDLVAFNQAELDALIDEGNSLIYLCANRFTIPLHVHNKTYVGIGKAIAVILSSGFIIDFDKFNIKFQNIKFDDNYNNVLKAPKLNEEKKLAAEREAERKKILIAEKLFDEANVAADKGNYNVALELFVKAAEAGNVEAMLTLAQSYSIGDDVIKNCSTDTSTVTSIKKFVDDLSEAIPLLKVTKWSINAIDKYLDDLMNLKRAVEWYKKAAEAGNSKAMNNLAVMYAKGKGVDIDKNQAFHWFKKSAEAGNIVAMRNLAKCYRNGEGVTQNIAQAEYWERKSNET